MDTETLTQTLSNCLTLDALEAKRTDFFGKNGFFSQAMANLRHLDSNARKTEGQRLNTLKAAFSNAYQQTKKKLEDKAIAEKITKESQDFTAQINKEHGGGSLNPLSVGMERMVQIFANMGFQMRQGPDIEEQTINFDALNIPPHHPARAQHDTFYIQNTSFLLRTHTSPVQIRTLRHEKPPLRVISAGRVFRDDMDATHTPMFHQIEGVVIEKAIHIGHLKGCLHSFLETFFDCPLKMRFRPNYFPFTEPSLEVDIFSDALNGGTWLEVLGCGMIHPHVIRSMNLDPLQHQGFAFGLGIERLTMLKYGLKDLRSFFSSDIRWNHYHGCVV